MNIKDLPWYNQPGFKLTKKGVHTLDTSELLSIIFWANDKEDDILGISNKILKRYNLHKIENAGYKKLVNLVCENKKAEYKDFVKVMKLLSLVELSKRYSRLIKGGYNNKIITCARDIYNLLVDEFEGKMKEYLYALFLDNKNRIIEKLELISIGTLDETMAHPREVFKEAFKKSAKRIILVHNHPSGDSKPSDEDKIITEKMFKTGDLIGIDVTDHIIIGKKSYYSFRTDKIYDLSKSSD